ncbi:MAG: NAD(P)-dependent oxidoreductase [Deltaproteobacteria bacterium]|nr:NAD(P)-dependent oxidoreductase [Deltaproteobacteria bacterium]
MKTILITGASGYVGKAFLKAYGRDYRFRVFGRTAVEGHEFFKGDIKNIADLAEAMKGVDAVVHLAAATTDGTGISDTEYFQTNTVGTFNVLEAAAKNGVKKVVYGSSVCAVGFRATPKLVMETDRCEPSDGMYGYSKYLSERLCECYAGKYGMKIIALRTAMVVPQHKIVAPANPFAAHWLGAVHIEDVLQAYRLAVDNETLGFEVFHIASGSPYSKFDINRAKEALGYRPAHNFSDIARPGLMKTIGGRAISLLPSKVKDMLASLINKGR